VSVWVAAGAGTGAAACFAVATAAQHRSAGLVPEAGGLQLRALIAFGRATLRQPLWLLGLATDVAGLALHVLALGQGSLALVQPLMTSGLLFALPARRLLDRQHATHGELVRAGLLVAGLSVFLVAADPVGGKAAADRLPAVLLAVALTLTAGGLLLAGRRRTTNLRAVLYGTATGIFFGATAALIKACTNTATLGWGELLSSPALWVLLVVGPAGFAVNQLAFQAGPLAASLPALTVVDPLVSLGAGLLVFDERLSGSPSRLAGAAAGLVVVVAASVALSRQEAIHDLMAPDHPSLPVSG